MRVDENTGGGGWGRMVMSYMLCLLFLTGDSHDSYRREINPPWFQASSFLEIFSHFWIICFSEIIFFHFPLNLIY